MVSRKSADNRCQWIALPGVKQGESIVAGYVLKFEVAKSQAVLVKVAADQQYELYLDGEFIGRGGESGVPEHWFFESYRLNLSKGNHVLAAKVWSWGGRHSAMAQMEVFHGFYLSSSRKTTRTLLGTGQGPWRVKALQGIKFTEHYNLPNGWTGVPPSQTLDAKRFPWSWVLGAGEGWKIPAQLPTNKTIPTGEKQRSHHLTPAMLPTPFSAQVSLGSVVFVSEEVERTGPLRACDDLKEEHTFFEALIAGKEIVLAAATERKILFDLKNYYCVYPSLTISGGKSGRVKLTWAESLFEGAKSMEKGDRNAVLNKTMRGIWDEFRLDGNLEREFKTLTWRAGRYLELTVESGSEALTLSLKLQETRFDLPIHDFFSCDDPTVNEIIPISVRSLQMSAHDNFVDCPFYERLTYSGDGRLEALAAYTISGDDLLARKAIQLFASSASANGLCMSRWPSREIQYIPTFSLWWIGMVYDFSMWRDDRTFVRSVLPAVRSTLEYFLTRLDSRGIYSETKATWNFVDWVPEWKSHPNGGAPPSEGGVNVLVNWILVYTLSIAAEIEGYAGEPLRARRYESAAMKIGKIIQPTFWDQEKELFRDDKSGKWFSEHCQIMAILSGFVPSSQRSPLLDKAFSQRKIAKSSLFFTHYLFEACFLADREDLFFQRLKPWNDFIGSGFTTVPENFQNTRSDCHGWGAHPLFHLVANIAGIKPAAFGFKTVRIAPRLGPLQEIKACCPHPRGMIRTHCSLKKTVLVAKIELPECLSGEFIYGDQCLKIGPGKQILRIKTHKMDGGIVPSIFRISK